MTRISFALGLGLCALIAAPVAAQCCGGGSSYSGAPAYSAPVYSGGYYGGSSDACCDSGYTATRRPFARRGLFQRRGSNNNCCPPTYAAQSYPSQSYVSAYPVQSSGNACCGQSYGQSYAQPSYGTPAYGMSGQPMMYTGSPCGCSGQYMNSGQNMNSGQYMNDGQFRNEGQNTNDGSYNNYEGSNDSAVVEPPASDDGSYTSTEKSVSERANSGNDGVEPPPVPTDNDDQ